MAAALFDLEGGGVVKVASRQDLNIYGSWAFGGGPTLRASLRWEIEPRAFLGLAARYRFMFYQRYGVSNTVGDPDGQPRVHELDAFVELQFDLGNHGPRLAVGPMLSCITNEESLRKQRPAGERPTDPYESPKGAMFDAGWIFGLSGTTAIAVSLSLAYLNAISDTWNKHLYLSVGYRYSLPL